MDPAPHAHPVPSGAARREGVVTRSATSGLKRGVPPPPPRDDAANSVVVTSDDDSSASTTDRASAAQPTPPASAADVGRDAAIKRVLDEAENALSDQQTTVAELTRRLQRQQDVIAQLQRPMTATRSDSGSKDPSSSRSKKKDKQKVRKEPIPEMRRSSSPASRLSFKCTASSLLGIPPSMAAASPRALVAGVATRPRSDVGLRRLRAHHLRRPDAVTRRRQARCRVPRPLRPRRRPRRLAPTSRRRRTTRPIAPAVPVR